ncbi:MAG: exodeoxyribonuclease III [Halofilum sp. (in: g-proteobacteria)]|nr:exodeoxyribonuclease III [Halofilum sp. (in: g-proteobacteria)]
MKIASWNVNSLKVRLPQVLDWLDRARPDVLALQETKLADDAFPAQAFRDAGWQVAFSGQKTYNGVAIVSRSAPADVVTDPPGLADEQRRLLAATIDGVRVHDLYVPNGQEVDSDKYAYKLDWLERLAAHLEGELARHPRLVVAGDFNIAPADADVHDPEALAGQIHCSERERAALRRLLDLGLVDTFRAFEQPPRSFSWWDYRANAFRRDLGLRIDLVLAGPALAPRCSAAGIDVGPRRNERPSDHAPVYAEFD